ncbi:PREDICTED: uncharacterized protein LOC109132601 [Camelina sativa]|uniref:Uncharacterized protein LOC109132601 n=1 Tax=Camelina sativa TaxID=90675 RepID=A0ABM1RLL2_CAMSA|nr:PREDICTED: uncharacterized protein LOC109132601 [Camelina sativa]
MGLSGSAEHGDLVMMMSLLKNLWLSMPQFLISITMAATSFLTVKVLFPLHRGVIVRVMMMCFIHGVLPGNPEAAKIADGVIMQICDPRRIWDPGITAEAFVVKIFNNVFGAMGFFYAMWSQGVWSFKQIMPTMHTYHTRVRWPMKKKHNMFNYMLVKGSTNSRYIATALCRSWRQANLNRRNSPWKLSWRKRQFGDEDEVIISNYIWKKIRRWLIPYPQQLVLITIKTIDISFCMRVLINPKVLRCNR